MPGPNIAKSGAPLRSHGDLELIESRMLDGRVQEPMHRPALHA
ncbi:hypothetical protein [Streptomyces sp. S3(2020)]|nr:hypothetical protein [Streptomyces sp. S3(2020)]